MKIKFTYEVTVTVNEGEGSKVETALDDAAKKFDNDADVTETDSEEVTDDETND